MEPSEIMWFESDGVRIEAMAHLPFARHVSRVPDAKEMVKRYLQQDA
jgi:hypothetical protein